MNINVFLVTMYPILAPILCILCVWHYSLLAESGRDLICLNAPHTSIRLLTMDKGQGPHAHTFLLIQYILAFEVYSWDHTHTYIYIYIYIYTLTHTHMYMFFLKKMFRYLHIDFISQQYCFLIYVCLFLFSHIYIK